MKSFSNWTFLCLSVLVFKLLLFIRILHAATKSFNISMIYGNSLVLIFKFKWKTKSQSLQVLCSRWWQPKVETRWCVCVWCQNDIKWKTNNNPMIRKQLVRFCRIIKLNLLWWNNIDFRWYSASYSIQRNRIRCQQ